MTTDPQDYRGLRLVFAGTPVFAAVHLQHLIEAGADIIAVYTQPDRRAGRGKRLVAGPVKTLAGQQGLPVHQPDTLKEPSVQETLAALGADVMVVVAYGLIIPEAVLALPRYGCINVHASLLPRWRGAAPIQRAIEAGDRETGITIMQMDAGLDTGDMLYKVSCGIEPLETGGSLHDKLATLGPPALIKTLDAIAGGSARGERQDDSKSCYAAKITKAEAEIDWRESAAVIDRKIRAFNPFPVAYTVIGDTAMRIWETRLLPAGENPAPAGTIEAVDGSGVRVACGDGCLAITAAQLAGKRRMPVEDLLRGHGQMFKPGTRLGQ